MPKRSAHKAVFARATNKLRNNAVLTSVMDTIKAHDPILVGGAVRDAIAPKPTSRKSRDLDFIIQRGNIERAASRIKRTFGGTIVRLKFEQTLRIVLRDAQVIDLSMIEGGGLEVDLLRRDFTINSIGWSRTTGLVDPNDGINDIEGCIIRAISEGNLIADPLRVLRAYRFAAECGFEIERATRALLRKYATLLTDAAGERITEEIVKILNSAEPHCALNMALRDGVLCQVLGVESQCLMNNLKLINRLPHVIGSGLFGLTRLGMLRLEALLLGIGLSGTRLVLSREARQRVESLSKVYARRLPRARTIRLYETFEEAADSANDLLLIVSRKDLLGELARYRRINANALVPSAEVMRLAGLSQGRELGTLLREIRIQRYLGIIKSKKDCMLWLKDNK